MGSVTQQVCYGCCNHPARDAGTPPRAGGDGVTPDSNGRYGFASPSSTSTPFIARYSLSIVVLNSAPVLKKSPQ